MSIAPARPASTVVLVRPASGRFEVFLVRRHDQIAFMGGAHVFPGGRVDDADDIEEAPAWCDGVERAAARMPAREPRVAVAFYVAAIRELFEEAGVLLARDASGGFVAIDGEAHSRFQAYRRDLLAGSLTLREVAERERLRLALDALALFAHWVTPEVETRRFDTHFFLAIAPARQDAAHDTGEATDGVWLPPEDATGRCLRGEIALPPPTWTTLRALADCEDVNAAWEWAASQRVPRVQPRVNPLADGAREIVLPGDPAYPAVEGFVPRETRFVLKDGRWIPAGSR